MRAPAALGRAGVRGLAMALGLALALMGIAVLAPPASAEVLPLTPVKIMPLGDSITNGVGATGGYRLELKDLMVPKGYSFDYVGGVVTGPFEIEDRQHEGHNGFKIADIASIAQAQVSTHKPDVVLLLVGTNDVTTDTALGTAPARLSSLMDTIYGAAPNASIVVGSIPPLADPTDDAQARAYNAALPDVVQSKVSAGRKASFADIYRALAVTDLVDGVHPNADGYFKMAKVWLPVLQALLPTPPASSADGCPCSVWPSTATPAVPQVSSATATEVGVRFRVEKYGQIRGIRFYKGTLNTGVHKGSLWARNGALLASATFTNETASGWQQVSFSTPVTVWPWTTYVASYFAPSGHYAADPSAFSSTEVVSSPVRLLAAGQSLGNGWSLGTSTGGFPSVASSQSANFWVDVVFTPVEPAPPPPPPSAPGGLRTTSVSSTQVGLTWNDVIGETGFRIERAPGGTNQWVAVGVAARDNWTFTDSGLAASTTYSYRVIATSRNGDSAPSSVLSVRTLAPPPPASPAGVIATAASSSQIDVAWQDVSGESGYQVQRSADGTSGWTQVGSTGADAVSFSNTGLAASTTYFYRVVATNSSGSSAPSTVVSATTPAPAPVVPATPAGVAATAVSSSQVDVAWQDVAGESGYEVQRSANGTSGWTQVGSTGPDEVSFSDVGLAASTTYFYRVVAANSAGSSAPSAVVSATTLASPPATPAGVTATAASSSQIDVAWQDVAGESGYEVQRSANGTSGWTQVGSTGPDEVSFSDVGLAASTTYFYRVVATNSAGSSAASAVVSATTQAPPPPATPAGATATAMSASQVDVSWLDVAGESGYAVERSANGSSGWTPVGTTGQDVTSFSDVGLAASTTYYYRVIATSGNGDSAPSSVVSATTFAPPAPGAPGGVSATAVSSSRIDVSWSDGAGESGYAVERSANGSTGWTRVGTTGQDVTSFSNTGLAASTTYYYRVIATSGNGNSPASAVVGATTLPAPPPATPTGITATAVSSSRIDVGWQDVAGESGYQLQRSLDGGSGWAEVGTTGPDVTSFSNTGLAASTTYYYRVVATSGSGDSPPSATASATTAAAADTTPPTVPTNLKASPAKRKVNLTWTASTDTGSGVARYGVYWSSSGSTGTFTLAATVTTASASISAASGVPLWFRVTAVDVAGNESAPSVVVQAAAK